MVKNGAEHPLNAALEANKGMMTPTLTPEALDTIEAPKLRTVDELLTAADTFTESLGHGINGVSRDSLVGLWLATAVELRRLRTENERLERVSDIMAKALQRGALDDTDVVRMVATAEAERDALQARIAEALDGIDYVDESSWQPAILHIIGTLRGRNDKELKIYENER